MQEPYNFRRFRTMLLQQAAHNSGHRLREFALLNCANYRDAAPPPWPSRTIDRHIFWLFCRLSGAHWTARAHRLACRQLSPRTSPNVHMQLSRTQKLCRDSKHRFHRIRRENEAFRGRAVHNWVLCIMAVMESYS